MRKTLFAALAALAFAASPALAQQDDVDVEVQTDRAQTDRAQTDRAQTNRARVQVENQRETDRAEVRREAAQPGQRMVAKAMRVSQLMDLEVRDLANEELGDVEDIVLDLQTGEVRYVALSVGGVLGVGDKLFAVPFKAFRVQNIDDEWVLTLNASKQKFENAPGFSDEQWPNFADENWRTTNDRYYSEQGVSVERGERAEREVEREVERLEPNVDLND
ncbi:PRC-barrel domain-containing protein [Candidatus Laterigemmans baculatus]|uniref:PRC-barrel domain-containing protein n=1 Tax=Candidatus Laterigemmans baculatus TaxID=2770505 RepID=UPI0013D99944|nr:PRC-barrel domain-containing protein [Candidatus Laterigemmans baculatus]